MAEAISVRLDKKTIKDLEAFSEELKADRSEILRRVVATGLKELKKKKILELLRTEKISIGKSAELLEISIYELLELMAQNEIPYGYSLKDLKADLTKV